jgi:ribonuclease HI
VIFGDGEMIEELSGGEAVTTSNRMEITAAIVGLQAVQEPSVITLYSDSQYLIKTLTQGWKRMKNLDLWERLEAAAKPHDLALQEQSPENFRLALNPYLSKTLNE